MTRALRDLIPSPDTRAWLRELYRVNPALAGEVAWAIHEGVLIDMGMVNPRVENETYANTHRHGEREYLVNQRTGECWFCGKIVPKEQVNPAQMVLGQAPQLQLEVR